MLNEAWVARIYSHFADDSVTVGTAYPLTEDLLVTAYHVVQGSKYFEVVWQHELLPDARLGTDAIVYEGSTFDCDIALIRCPTPLSTSEFPIIATKAPKEHAVYSCRGYPLAGQDVKAGKHEPLPANGKFAGGYYSHYFELISDTDIRSEKHWGGLSGAPVFVNGELCAVVDFRRDTVNRMLGAVSLPWLMAKDERFNALVSKQRDHQTNKVDIFISYSHADEVWKNEIQKHLRVLQMHGQVSIWDDRQIEVGEEWLPKIEAAISQARVAILLVSVDFLTSKFIARQEIPKFLERSKADGLRIVPVIVHPCAWKRVPWLAGLQGATKDNMPLSQYDIKSYQFHDLVAQIVEKVDDLLKDSVANEDKQQQAFVARLQKPVPQAVKPVPSPSKQPISAPVPKPIVAPEVLIVKTSEQRLIECWKRRANFDFPFEPIVFPYKNEPNWGEDQYGLWQALDVIGIRHVFRWIPAGTFMMGSPDEEEGRYGNEDYHQVTLTKGFWLCETPVTQMQYQNVIGVNPSVHKQHLDAPVEKLFWRGIQLFIEQFNQHCNSLKVRLPWEAEWEYACRAGTTTPFYFEGKITLEKANYRGHWNDWMTFHKNAIKATTPVKSYAPNPWGLYDMIGNVWEVCADVSWDHLGKDAVIDPKISDLPNSDTKKIRYIVKGGCYGETGRGLRSAKRWSVSPRGTGSQSVGFRLAIGE